METETRNIIFFDGVCNLCNGAVQFILKRDKTEVFSFASLQSEFAQAHLRNFPNLPKDLDSIVYSEGGKTWYKSAAVFRIAKKLGGIYRVVNIFRVLPGSWNDKLYDYIAKNRYRWFGKKESCMVPDPALKSRFLD